MLCPYREIDLLTIWVRTVTATQTGTQSIDRAAGLLARVLEAEEPPSVAELADAAGLARSTAARLVAALERHGLVQREGGDRGRLAAGPLLRAYAARCAAPDLVAVAGPTLDRLAALTGETVNLGVPTAAGVDHLDQRDSSHFLGSTNWVGRVVPFHATSSGKAFLALGVVDLPPGPLEALAPGTIVDRDVLERDLAAIRASGVAVAIDELEPGLAALAVPVRDASGAVVAALSISGPSLRLTPARRDALGTLLVEEAAALSACLGHRNTTQGAA
jgi:DNA-binding IclR family transcriptional regulator